MDDLLHMSRNEMFTFWTVAIGVIILICCFTYIIARNIKQKRKREAFSQAYGIDLPKDCLVNPQKDAGSVNTLILAYPYVNGQRTGYSGLNSGFSTGNYGVSYGNGSPQYIYNNRTGYSGFSTGSSTTQDTICHPYSELTIDSYTVEFKNPFSAYKAVLKLRNMGHKIMPCMEEKIKSDWKSSNPTDGSNDAEAFFSSTAESSIVLTPDDIMVRVEPRFVSDMSPYYRDLMEYEASKNLV